MFRRFASRVNNVLEKYTYTAGFVVCGVKGSCADIISQKYHDHNDEINWKRNVGFTLFASTFTGIWQNYLYSDLMQKIFGHSSALRTVLIKATTDVFGHSVFIYMPVGFFCTNLFTGNENPMDAVKAYFSKEQFPTAAGSCVAVWYPAQLICFMLPPHLRVFWDACVSFCYLMVLSSLAYQGGDEIMPSCVEEKPKGKLYRALSRVNFLMKGGESSRG